LTNAEVLLASLQNADSFFPSGGVSFSWGLETLIADGAVRGAEQVDAYVEGQLRYRWAICDRVALVAAVRAAGDILRLTDIDSELEAMTLAMELREGSKRAGASLLTVHERLGTPGAAPYRAAIRAGNAHGHLPVVQGLLWCGAGLSETAVEAVSAHIFCVGMLGAALRLGSIGHIQGQETLLRMRPVIAELLGVPALPMEGISACVPAVEIAAMRHEVQSARLFAN
jgi:urease accessory protein